MKECPKCKEEKQADEFGKCSTRKDGLQTYCKSCRKDYATANKKKLAKYHKEYRKKDSYQEWYKGWVDENRESINATTRAYHRKLRLAAIKAYGGPICVCCGEKEETFLVIDHIDGGGNQHRKRIGMSGFSLYQWLKKHDYPEGFQILCQNCNWGKHVHGICPHKMKESK
jgi:transposase-like protein